MAVYWGRQAAGALIFAVDTGRVLLLLRSEEVMEPGLWGIPGGRVEAGEDPRETALVETSEECGDTPGLVVDFAPIDEWRASDGDFVYYTFRASVPAEFVPTLNWESDDYRWAEPADAARDPGVHHNVRRVLAGLEVDQKDVKCDRGRRRFIKEKG